MLSSSVKAEIRVLFEKKPCHRNYGPLSINFQLFSGTLSELLIEEDTLFSFTFPAEQLIPCVVTLYVILKAHLSRSREDRKCIPHSQGCVGAGLSPRLLVPSGCC